MSILEILTTSVLFLRLGLGLCNFDQRRFALDLVGLFLVLVVLLTEDLLLLLLLLLNCWIADDNEDIFLLILELFLFYSYYCAFLETLCTIMGAGYFWSIPV